MSNINPYIHDFTVDLRNGVTMERAKKPLSQGDAFANKIVVHVLKDGQTVPLDGVAVSASVIRYDGATVPLTGTVEEGAACIVLNDECYAVPGDLLVSVVLAVGEVKQTILRLMLNVETSQTDIIADGGVIGSFSQLLAEIENMRSATAAAISAAERAEAAADKAEGIAPGGGGTGTVTSVNGVEPDEEGNVQITIPEVPAWAMAATKPTYTAKEVGADPAGTAASKVSTHNADEEAHPAIRQLVSDLSGRLSALADSDDTTLDQLSEIVAYIKSNKSLIDSITTGKVSTADIVNNLTSTATNKPLSAAQGKVLKALIDAIVVPTKLSELAGDATHRLVTDAEKTVWNAKSTFSGKYADLTGTPTKVSVFENDAGYLTEHQDISHLLPRTELGAAVDVALAEAKASGAFDGEDGKTPVVGVDYYTPAEKAEFSQYIASEMAKRGQLEPEFANSIDDCTDESKLYVLPDGYIYAYMAYKTEGSKVPNFTNLMDDSGAYIKDGYRYSSSSAAFKTQASDCAVVIPINAAPSADMTIRMRGAKAGAAYASSSYFGPTNQAFPNAQGGNAPVFTTESNGDVTITVKNAAASGTKYGVFHVKSGVDADSLIVTLNEPITYTTTEGGTEYRWASTGHAFVPADYEGRIIALEDDAEEHEERIADLEEKVQNIDADASKDAAYARIKYWNAPVYDDAPVFLLETPKAALDANSIAAKPVAGIYAAYDALMEQYPHYITREDCGLASDGATHIYAYHFKTPVTRDNQGNTAAERKPTILACSGVHPLEQAGVYSLYYAMEEITTNTELGDLRRNVHFVVVPMLNPTAVSDTEYHMRNPDGIQVHYNFEVEFGSNGAVQGDQNYGGATPLSIPESQYFDALMAEYQDNLACVLSCHNFGRDNSRGAGYIWWSCGTNFMVNLGIRFCEKMSDAWRKKYGDAFAEGVQWANDYAVANWGGTAQPDWDLRVGWANLSGSGGSEYRQAIKYGVHGVNVEVCPLCMVLDKDATAYYSSNAMTWGAETYINFFLTYMSWYDLMRKQEYAPNLPWKEG